MTLQVVASFTIVSLTNLEVPFTLLVLSITHLEKIYSTGVTHDDCHVTIYIFLRYRPL